MLKQLFILVIILLPMPFTLHFGFVYRHLSPGLGMDFQVFGICVKLVLKTFQNAGQFLNRFYPLKIQTRRTSLIVQWLGLAFSLLRAQNSNTGQGTKVPQATHLQKNN